MNQPEKAVSLVVEEKGDDEGNRVVPLVEEAGTDW